MGETVASGMQKKSVICLGKLKGCKMWHLAYREKEL